MGGPEQPSAGQIAIFGQNMTGAPPGQAIETGQTVTLCTRPERIGLSPTANIGAIGPFVVRDKSYLGKAVEYHLHAQSRPMVALFPCGGLGGQQDFDREQTVFARFEPDATRILVV